MLLVIDVGNTNITLGVFRGEEILGSFRMKSKQPRTSDEYGITLQELVERHGIPSSEIRHVIIASVVPDIMHSLGSAIIKYFHVKPIVVSAGIKTGIRIVTENPRQVGPDRIVDAVGAYTLHGGPVIVVDFGTATTYDIIGPDGTFEAGLIAPGLRTSAQALWGEADMLPAIEIRKPASIPQKELEAFIASLNADPAVDGILLQLPLPEGLDARPCIDAISPEKDVDGLTAVNQGRVAMNVPGLRPCTPAGILAILDRYGISVSGKRAVVIGRSNLVGRPIALMLGSRDYNATVTMCHSRTPDLAAICREADIIVAALGRPRFVTADMVRPGAVIIDVGINRGADGRLCGDVDYDNVAPIASAITPVPGGIGPMTISQLLVNTEKAWRKKLLEK